jgi:urease accessory protein
MQAVRVSTATEVRTARVALWPADGRCRIELATGLLAPRLVRHDSVGAHVALVATTAALLGGDRLALDVEVGPGLRLDLQDVAGTVAFHGRGLGCRVDVVLRVHEGARLSWAGRPVVVAEGAELTRTMHVDVAAGGRLLMRDQLVLGRAGEAGGSVRCRTTITYAGLPALVEDLDLRVPRREPGLLGGARVVDSVVAIGWRPSQPGLPVGSGPPAVSVMSLQAPGALARAMVHAAHDSRVPALLERWAHEVDERQPDLGGQMLRGR